MELVFQDRIFDHGVEYSICRSNVLSADQIFNPYRVIQYADHIFDLEIVIQYADRILDLEILIRSRVI